MKPFLKWAGGKRWLTHSSGFQIPKYSGTYIEPFLGGGSVFFHAKPKKALLSDKNPKLIETYQTIRDRWAALTTLLEQHQKQHSKDYYYTERAKEYTSSLERSAQFLYLNRTCWNGLYRENRKGKFNVPMGTKTKIVLDDDDFEGISNSLQAAELKCCDFSESISMAGDGDFIFADPPYTTAHNTNGFIKYNQEIFSWEDQIRLRDDLKNAAARGAAVILTNAYHESVADLYAEIAKLEPLSRSSIISGKRKGRKNTEELLIRM